MYAQHFTTLWVVLAYSSGMPVLYPIACLNYFIIYWVYKTLLIKHYKKTTAFNQDLPFFSIYYFKIGIILHILLGAFIFTNGNILSSQNLEMIQNLDEEFEEEFIDEDETGLIFRFTSGIGTMYVSFVSTLIVLYVFKKILGVFLGILLRIICSPFKKNVQ